MEIRYESEHAAERHAYEVVNKDVELRDLALLAKAYNDGTEAHLAMIKNDADPKVWRRVRDNLQVNFVTHK